MAIDVTASHGGNAAEARRLRGIMGFNKASTDHSFTFNFPAASTQPTSFSVFVGGMPYKWTRNEVTEFWSECGTVLDVDCMTFRDTGRFKGIAKITFETHDGYENALSCDGDEWDGCSFVVKPWKEKTSHVASSKETASQQLPSERLGKRVEGFDVLFLCNLPTSMLEDDIVELFQDFDIEAVKLKRDPESNRSKGYAHIHFRQSDQLERAIQKLDGSTIQGRIVRLGYAIPPPNWKPKESKVKKENDGEELDAYAMGDGRYLVRLSGLQPTMRLEEVKAMFSDAAPLDVQLIWSAKKGQGSGAVYLVMQNVEGLQTVLKKNDTFYRGRRLHVRPGDASDYRRRTQRSKKRKQRRKEPNGDVMMHSNDINEDDDPLMALL